MGTERPAVGTAPVGEFHPFLALLGAVALVASGCSTTVPRSSEEVAVVVKAQILGANGVPFGGAFGVVGKDTRRLIASGSVDCLGMLEIECRLPPGETGIVVGCISTRMVRNAEDEWLREERDLPRRTSEAKGDALPTGSKSGSGNVVSGRPMGGASGDEFPRSRIDVFDGKIFVDYDTWEEGSIHSWTDLLREYGDRHAVTTRGPDGRSIDSVARTSELGGSGVVDVGDLQFPRAFPALECVVLLRGADGNPVEDPVMLTGFPFRQAAHRPEHNAFYPHFALAQRKDAIRVIATSAGVRALLATGDRSFYLRPTHEGGRSVRVSLPEFTMDSSGAMIRVGPIEVALTGKPDDAWMERWGRLFHIDHSDAWPAVEAGL